MTKIKLCGLRRVEDMLAVNEAAPDYAGIILARNPKFWRAISPEQAALLRRTLRPEIPLVGVFVDDDEAYIVSLLTAGIIDIAQLHGGETEETIRSLRFRTGKPVWKALRVRQRSDLDAARSSPADLLLLDGGTGTGTGFDWSLAEGFPRPFLLAGGLNPENLPDAIRRVRPWGVDLSSGTETNRVKDREKLLAAVRAARETETCTKAPDEYGETCTVHKGE